jgi:hypothetical protein
MCSEVEAGENEIFFSTSLEIGAPKLVCGLLKQTFKESSIAESQ